jgi:hypothetical protein
MKDTNRTLHLFAWLLMAIPIQVISQNKLLKPLENVQLEDSTLLYEQRVNRSQYKYFSKITSEYPAIKYFSPLFKGVPVGTYTATQGNIKFKSSSNEAKKLKPFSKQYKWDFWIQPQFSAIFGNLNKAVENKTNILLNTELIITNGFSLYTGITFPLVNDLDNQPLNIRLAPTYFNYFHHKNSPDYLSLSAGLFFNDRYGLNAEYQHMDFNKTLSFGLEGSYSGFYYLYPDSYKYTDLRELLVLANLAYRFPRNDVTLNLIAGQFLYYDKGFRLELIRQYTKAEIGFFGSFTENGATIGINLAFKIPPSAAIENKHIRLRTSEDYNWEYVYSRGFKIAERYRLHYKLDQKLRQYHRSFWQSELNKSKYGNNN